MRRAPLATATLAGALLSGLPAAAEPPAVVVSIKPLHSLAAAVMEGIGQPTLLIEGAASPHDYSLRPSDARALQEADLVLWAGPSVESFLDDALEGLVDDGVVLEAQELDGILLLPPREGGLWEEHDHAHDHGDEHDHDDEHAHDEDEHDHDEHDHGEDEHAHDEHDDDHDHHHDGEIDSHLWLNPANGRAILAALADSLSDLDPENAETYRQNAAVAAEAILTLDGEIAAALAPVSGRPYIVFHDAYQYFEQHYGLAAIGSITVSPDRPPGARRLDEIRHKLEEAGAVCVFAEPQFEPDLVATLVEGTGVRSGTLDPLGSTLEAGSGAYPALLRGLASDLVACLGEG